MSVDEAAERPQSAPEGYGVAWVAPARPLPHLGQILGPLAAALTDQRVELTAICPLAVDIDGLPATMETVRYRPVRAWALHPKMLADLADQIQERNIKLLHALQAESLPLTARLAKAAGISYVVSSYSPADARRLGRLAARAAAVLAASEKIHEGLVQRRAIEADRIHLVRPGVIQVEHPTCFRDPGRSIAIVAGGNLNKFAAFDAVLRTLAELRRREYDCMCFFIGSGRGETRLRAVADSLGLLNTLTFAGDQPNADLARVFEAADVYICAATNRAVEIQSLLAMAAGIPVLVAGELAGDFIVDGKTSLRFLVGGRNVLTGKLTALLDDHREAAAMAGRALAHLRENHSVANMAALTAGTYRQAQQEAS